MREAGSKAEQLARLLGAARVSGAALGHVPADLVPDDADSAYRTQEFLLDLGGQGVGGWKVGAKSEDGPMQGAPLPAVGIKASPARLRPAPGAVVGLELEIAFRLGRAFAPSVTGYPRDQVIGSLASMAAAIEVVSSRLAGWPEVDRRLQLADLLNHGALVVGSFVDYDGDFPFRAPAMSFRFNGEDIAGVAPANPAGDPRRLLAWIVNHCTSRGRGFEEGTLITTGSYTGIYRVRGGGTALGEIAGLPAVRLAID